MSATPPIDSLELSSVAMSAPRRNRIASQWLREPLLHFVILGGALFALDHFMVARSDDPHLIVVGGDVDRAAVEAFETSRGRKPNDQELEALHRVWLDNEVLYREGLAMQLDKGDDAIRDRVIFKALSVVDANVKLPTIDDSALRQWFEKHRNNYDEPARYDFDEAALTGDASEGAVRAFVQALNNGKSGDAQAGLRVFKGRPQENLVQSYGEDFAKLLSTMAPGQWQALQTRGGWRAIKLNNITPAKPADFNSLHDVVLQDWKDETAAEQRTAAVRAFAKKYQIKYEPHTDE